MRRLVLLTLVSLLAVSASAQMNGMEPVVAPDGTVIVIRPSIATDYRMTTELIAVSPAGTQLWKWEGGAGMSVFAVAGGRVIVARGAASGTTAPGMPMHGIFAAAGEIVALSLTGGTVQWRRDVTGIVSGIRAEGDRVYVVTGGMPAAGRVMRPVTALDTTLVALNAATGAVLWSTTLK